MNVDRVFGPAGLIGDSAKNTAFVTRYGQLEVSQRHDDILARFEYNNSLQDVTITTTGTGASSNATSLAIASTGASTGLCRFQSKRNTQYRPGHQGHAFLSATFTAGAANTTQYAGLYDAQDGFIFGYTGTTFGIIIRKGASDTAIPQSTWNKDKLDGTGDSKFTLDQTKGNQYAIMYGWLGVAPISFYVYGGEDKGWILCHVYDITNIATTPSILSPCLPVTWEAERTSGSGAITVSVGSMAAGRAVGEHTHAGHRVFAGRATKTLVAGVETYIATFKNNATFQSKLNKVLAEAAYFGAASDGTKSVEFLFYRNATVTGSSYTSVDAANSVMSYDIAGASSAGSFEMSVPLAKVDRISLDVGSGHIHLELLPGDTMTITGLSAGASDVIVAFRWEEYFS
jgi:hypothetical protein